MNAQDLIALSESHPKAFALLGVRRSERADGGLFNLDGMELPPWADSSSGIAQQWVKWLTGAAVQEFTRRGWDLPKLMSEGWWLPSIVEPSPLHAMLAAIEATKEQQQ